MVTVPARKTASPPQKRGLAIVGFFIFALLALAYREGAWRLATLAGVGLVAGIALYHASFGFTAAWRRFVLERRSNGLRAQIVMLGIASLIFFPAIGAGQFFGQPVGGYVFPVGLALILGAFLFGIGMQLGGGCGSGTLFTIGGGSIRMLVTLAFFIVGATLASAFADHWFAWPKWPAISIIRSFGVGPALLAMMIGLGALYGIVVGMERRRHGHSASIFEPQTQWLSGPWALVLGALALAFVNIATLILSGWPWGITGAFALWGAKIYALAGGAPENWTFFQGQQEALVRSVFADVTSVMDFAIILGAMVAALMAGKFRPGLAIPWRSLAAAIIGGLLLGIGARLGTGCNIGAFFSGTVSGSVHGWVWLLFAFFGNIAGIRLRPLFRLD